MGLLKGPLGPSLKIGASKPSMPNIASEVSTPDSPMNKSAILGKMFANAGKTPNPMAMKKEMIRSAMAQKSRAPSAIGSTAMNTGSPSNSITSPGVNPLGGVDLSNLLGGNNG